MNLSHVFESIESVEFETFFAVIDNVRIFDSYLGKHEILIDLIEQAKNDSRIIDEISRHVLELGKDNETIQFQHRHDIPIAAYLFVLRKTKLVTAFLSANALANIPNFWWASKIAKSIVEEVSHGTSATSATPANEPSQSSVTHSGTGKMIYSFPSIKKTTLEKTEYSSLARVS